MTLNIFFRLLGVVVLIGIWHLTQSILGKRGLPDDGKIGDKVHIWMAPLHAYLSRTPWAVSALLITSSLGIDVLGLSVLYLGIFGPSFRPIIGLVALLMLRQSAQYLTALPAPEGMIWRNPGFPSLFVTYGVSNDLFFSGHTGLAVYGSLTLASLGIPWLTAIVILIGLYEVFAVLALRAHWTMDVYAGLVSAILCWVVSGIFPNF
ncbi:MAG: hypothetical protein J0I12_12660 [Candidatus Eremiobacteraeota bacterium]|nr:hypothetical protein [Candidatus Eremiobacteraeota bacterium]